MRRMKLADEGGKQLPDSLTKTIAEAATQPRAEPGFFDPAQPLPKKAAELVKSTIERYQRLEDEIKGLKADQNEIIADAANEGLDTKVIKDVLKLLRFDDASRELRLQQIELYLKAIGTPRPGM